MSLKWLISDSNGLGGLVRSRRMVGGDSMSIQREGAQSIFMEGGGNLLSRE